MDISVQDLHNSLPTKKYSYLIDLLFIYFIPLFSVWLKAYNKTYRRKWNGMRLIISLGSINENSMRPEMQKLVYKN